MKLKIYNNESITRLSKFNNLSIDYKKRFHLANKVFQFRTNNYVVDELINWADPLNDPVFYINFFHPDSLSESHYKLLQESCDNRIIQSIIRSLHPDPDLNSMDSFFNENYSVEGVQQKFDDICIVFPRKAQQCHAFCTFCFRWTQFIDVSDDIPRYYTDDNFSYLQYIKSNKDLREVLFTGGDPIFLGVENLKEYIAPLLTEEFDHIKNIRIGTKSLGFWPYRFLSDNDSDELIRFFEVIVKSGRHLSIIAHFNHWKELENEAAQKAIKRIQSTGAIIRTQSPMLRHVNDDVDTWVRMLNEEVRLGCIPYYMLVERITGAYNAFSMPLSDVLHIFKEVYRNVTGLAKTIRGPVMSTYYGKILIHGILEISGKKYFVLSFTRSRKTGLDGDLFLAEYDAQAKWLSDLKPSMFGGFPF